MEPHIQALFSRPTPQVLATTPAVLRPTTRQLVPFGTYAEWLVTLGQLDVAVVPASTLGAQRATSLHQPIRSLLPSPSPPIVPTFSAPVPPPPAFGRPRARPWLRAAHGPYGYVPLHSRPIDRRGASPATSHIDADAQRDWDQPPPVVSVAAWSEEYPQERPVSRMDLPTQTWDLVLYIGSAEHAQHACKSRDPIRGP